MLRRIVRKIYRRLNPKPKTPVSPTPSYTPPPPATQVEEEPPEESQEEIDVEVEASVVLTWQEEGKNPILVDIRQPYELGSGYIPDSLLIPMNQLATQVELFPKDVPIVLYCAAGARSFGMAHFMREKGFDQAWSMIGGVGEWNAHSFHPKQAKFSLFQEVQYKEENMIVWGAESREDKIFYRLHKSGTLHLEKDVEESEITT